MIITTPDQAAGFQLAGAETFAVEDSEQAEKILQDLRTSGDASLIVIRQDLLAAMSPRLQRQVEESIDPIVMAIPGDTRTTSADERQQQIADLIRRAIGFHITFGSESAEAGRSHD